MSKPRRIENLKHKDVVCVPNELQYLASSHGKNLVNTHGNVLYEHHTYCGDHFKMKIDCCYICGKVVCYCTSSILE